MTTTVCGLLLAAAGALLLPLLVAAQPGPGGPEPPGALRCDAVHNPDGVELAGLRRTFATWKAAMAAGDVDALAELLTEDVEFWTHGQAPLVGRQASAAALAPLLRDHDVAQDFACDELFVSPHWALARGTEHNLVRPRDGDPQDPPRRIRQRAFSVLRRGDDGVWRFARGMTNLGPPDSGSDPAAGGG